MSVSVDWAEMAARSICLTDGVCKDGQVGGALEESSFDRAWKWRCKVKTSASEHAWRRCWSEAILPSRASGPLPCIAVKTLFLLHEAQPLTSEVDFV